MKDLGKALKLMKYTYHYQCKDEKYAPFIMLIIGLFALAGSVKDGFNLAVAAPPLVISVAYIGNFYSCLTYSHLVGTSGKRRQFDLIIPNLFLIIGVIWSYLLITVMVLVSVHNNPEMSVEYGRSLLNASELGGLLIILFGISNKHYGIGVLVAACIILPMNIFMIIYVDKIDNLFGFPLNHKIGLLFLGLILVICTILSCLLRMALYKVPIQRGKIGKKMLNSM